MPPAVAGASESRHDSPRFGPWRRLAALAVLLCATAGASAGAAETSLAVSDGPASGRVMLLASRDLARPQPDIVRAVITIHGLHRDAGHYDAIARQALAMAGPAGRGTLLLTPRFAGAGHGGPADLLRWPGNTWMDGQPATAPALLSSFAVMDGLLARLSDRRLFPALATVVLVGHSAGGQFVQRYAVLGHGLGRAAAAGLAVRFVIANPSSYAYPDRDRPTQAGGFAQGPAAACPGYDRWKYGLDGLPAYAGAAPATALARAYVARDVTILLGGLDDDPALAVLDKSCAAEAQGPTHLARGRAFVRLLRTRYAGAPHQRLHEIAGVGHDAAGMLTSACALAAIYGTAPCEAPKPAAGGP